MIDLLQLKYFAPLCILFFFIFIFREIVSFKRILPVKYFLTPLVTLSIMLFVLLSINIFGLSQYSLLILLGLVISLVADTLLMIEEISFFKNGLVFFLMTHVLYMGAFSLNFRFQSWHAAVGGVLLTLMIVIYRKIYLVKRKHDFWVLLYMIVLSAMCFLAFSFLGSGSPLRAVLLPVGATLFVISDAVLAINTFVKKIPHSTVLTWSFYAPAKFLIALSCFF